MVRKLREIFDELLHQRLGSAVIGLLVGPCLARIEQRSVDPRHRDRDEEAEIRVLAELGIVEAAIKRSVEQRAGRLDRHALDPTHRRHATGPAGVDEPALDAALGDAVLEEIAIDRRVARHEGGAEAGREGRSEEHTSELQSLMRTSYAVFCLKKK